MYIHRATKGIEEAVTCFGGPGYSFLRFVGPKCPRIPWPIFNRSFLNRLFTPHTTLAHGCKRAPPPGGALLHPNSYPDIYLEVDKAIRPPHPLFKSVTWTLFRCSKVSPPERCTYRTARYSTFQPHGSPMRRWRRSRNRPIFRW
jgi:hypothetical protein